MTQVERFVNFDRDVTSDVNKFLRSRKAPANIASVQFVTTVLTDPKAPNGNKVQYEAYVTYRP